MKYCKECVLPDTRPGIEINNEGICSACIGHRKKTDEIDWESRAKRLDGIFESVKQESKTYDCLIPVSGGKDSTWQVVKCLERGMRVLAVTWRTPLRTELGQKNLENLISLGVDHIDYSINPEVERKFTYKALYKTGSTGVPMHMALYSIPLRLAAQLDIPLVVWGESPHMEYGGNEDQIDNDSLNLEWFNNHGILQNTSALDWVDEELTQKDMIPYMLPEKELFEKRRIRSIFLGYYLKWDPEMTLKVAIENGFSVRKEGPKVGYYNYADIDCDLISTHHYFKWLKFGFTRLFDNLSLEIRNGRMTREEALDVIKAAGPQVPVEDIQRLCEFLKITVDEFNEIGEKFRNVNVWKMENGKWVIPDFIIPDWSW